MLENPKVPHLMPLNPLKLEELSDSMPILFPRHREGVHTSSHQSDASPAISSVNVISRPDRQASQFVKTHSTLQQSSF